LSAKHKLIWSPVNQSKCGKAESNKTFRKRNEHVPLRAVLLTKTRRMLRLMTVKAKVVMTLSVPSVMDYSLMTVKVKRGSGAQNVFNGRTKCGKGRKEAPKYICMSCLYS
jgi:hypothetical protein